jgi:hypothetical protein
MCCLQCSDQDFRVFSAAPQAAQTVFPLTLLSPLTLPLLYQLRRLGDAGGADKYMAIENDHKIIMITAIVTKIIMALRGVSFRQFHPLSPSVHPFFEQEFRYIPEKHSNISTNNNR